MEILVEGRCEFSLLEQLDIPYPEDNEECHHKHFHRPEREFG